ncbi:MAG: hypothetical protein IPL95_10525 [Saprospiraceae bacterium]|nr:hypothetical protein [Saprospiraceae bacterium]
MEDLQVEKSINSFAKSWSFDGIIQSSGQHTQNQSSTAEIVFATTGTNQITGFGVTNYIQPQNQVLQFNYETLNASNTCPNTKVNLNSLVSSSTPSGASLVWFTNNSHTGTEYATPTMADAGTYYAFYYNSSTGCYSAVGATVNVTINNCVTRDTVTTTPSCPTCPVTVCKDTIQQPTTGTTTYSTCGTPVGYTITGPTTNGCFTYTPNGNVSNPVTTCVIACNNGVCDTTVLIINKPISPDTATVTPTCPTCPVTVCPIVNDVTGTGITYNSCGNPTGYSVIGPNASGCYTYTPNGTVTNNVTTCIVSCKNGICDTTYVSILAPLNPDTDGDGVPDSVETANGTDPNDPCSYNVADITAPITSTVDCDGDGVTDKNEIYGPDGVITGTDGTDPKNACSLNLSQVTVTATSTGDCDGDGVTNANEINSTGTGDPVTDPNDPCNYNTAEQVLANTSTTWKALDCDKDGNNNGTDPNPKVPTAVGDVLTATLGTTSTVNVLTNDDFVAGANTTITKTGGTAGGTVTFDPLTGLMSYIPLASEEGTTKTVIYNVCNTAVTPQVCDTAIVTITIPLDPDTDGDGVPDSVETANGTNPNDACSYNVADITKPITSTVDCDGDGVTDKNEIYGPDGVITGTDGTDPKNACSLNLSQVTVTATSTGDCDGDGVTNANEINSTGIGDPVTDPNDPCNYNTAEQVLANTSTTWKALDCDKDGNNNGTDPNPKVPTAVGDVLTATLGTTSTVNVLTNDDFVAGANTTITKTGGTAGGTVTFDPLTGLMSYIPLASEEGTTKTVIYNVCNTAVTPQVCDTAIVTITIPLDPDTDGDGVPDSKETANGTDPNDPCSFILANQTVLPSTTWMNSDCDGDGVTNQKEKIDGTDPLDGCEYVAANITLARSATWNAADCDGDGVTNGKEVTDGTDPLDPCKLIVASQTLPTSSTWKALDCDGDGIPNGVEITDGTNPLNPDTDGDGVTDGKEITDGTNPLLPCDFIQASQTVATSAAWKLLDCDGDGVTNQQEIIDGTNPLDPCSLVVSNQTVATTPTWNALDCDGDGVTNGKEVTDGTSPIDPCSLIVASQTIAPSSTWVAADCDNDGVTNGVEITDGTNPLSPDTDGDGVTDGQEKIDGTNPLVPCDFVQASQTLATSAAWKLLDCDGDGVTNQQEILDGTNPLNSCSFKLSSQTVLPSTSWNNTDCDGDGVTNGTEKTDGTNPLDYCSLIITHQTLAPSASWNSADCDKDGNNNGSDPIH